MKRSIAFRSLAVLASMMGVIWGCSNTPTEGDLPPTKQSKPEDLEALRKKIEAEKIAPGATYKATASREHPEEVTDRFPPILLAVAFVVAEPNPLVLPLVFFDGCAGKKTIAWEGESLLGASVAEVTTFPVSSIGNHSRSNRRGSCWL